MNGFHSSHLLPQQLRWMRWTFARSTALADKTDGRRIRPLGGGDATVVLHIRSATDSSDRASNVESGIASSMVYWALIHGLQLLNHFAEGSPSNAVNFLNTDEIRKEQWCLLVSLVQCHVSKEKSSNAQKSDIRKDILLENVYGCPERKQKAYDM